ncbi:NAD(P)/FAD-dependent oxidoreductase [Bacillus sp. GM_Baccil_2]|uniref:flavin monoamine oxidase family protein n=1 Tax=Bacillus sp. GM_Baccil_2 TaxID=2937369 RepID=UPI00226A9480
MPHTPLASILQKAYAAAHNIMGKQTCNEQTMMTKNNISNKDLVYQKNEKKPTQKIVIVGAGLAGLTCAYRLKQQGISSTIYEATNRIGGRCWTRRNYFEEEQIVERGGELIDTGHIEIQKLATELGLVLDDLIAAESIGTKPFYFFDGLPYTVKDATKDFLTIYHKLQKDLKEVGESTLYNNFTERGFELDHMSIVDYINVTVPGGIHSKLGQLLCVAYTIEYGADAHKQSSLNLLYLLGTASNGPIQLFGKSDERFRIKGGNDQLPLLLAKKLNGQIKFKSELIKIEQTRQKNIKLTFQNDEKEWEVFADKVVLTVPFSIMRTIDYTKAKFCSLKKIAIEELGMGINTKLHAQFLNRFWRKIGNNGETFADTGYQNTFEVSRAQKGKLGILVNFTGGKTAAEQCASTDEELEKITKEFLKKLEPVLPESKKNWNGLSTIDNWLSNPWTKGSYSFWKVGQYTKFAGIEREREGNIFFAGEHTSIDYQGYLNGAVETGERASQELIEDLSEKK